MKRYLLPIGALVLCANFSEQTSSSKETPDINFLGTITSQAGEKINAENITIGGRYEKITVYSQPGKDIDPKQAEVKLDLTEIREINVQTPAQSLFVYTPPAQSYIASDGTKQIRTLKGVEYTRFEVVYKDTAEIATKIYLIERDKKIWFDELIGPNRIEHRANLDAIKQIKIEEIAPNKEMTSISVGKKNFKKPNEIKENNINQMESTISKLEDTVSTMTPDSSMSIEHWKQKLIELLRELRDLLAKILG